MDMTELLRLLGLRQAYDAYQRNIGQPVANVAGPFGRGLLGLERPEYGEEEAYRTGQAVGNMPGPNVPAGLLKAAAQAPELTGLLASVAPKVFQTYKSVDFPQKEGVVRLYHGGGDPGFEKVPEGGRFDGFFALPDEVGGHGIGHNYFADIPQEKILTNYDLNYELPLNKVVDAFEKTTGIKQNDPRFDSAWKAIIEETRDANEMALAAKLADDFGDAGWEAQRLRGQIAKRLGYDAIEMSDEHGSSYLIVSGVPLKYIGSKNK